MTRTMLLSVAPLDGAKGKSPRYDYREESVLVTWVGRMYYYNAQGR